MKIGILKEDPMYPIERWKEEVQKNLTLLGYEDWVAEYRWDAFNPPLRTNKKGK